jgi:uncharacterized protein YecE (DUF72 family)
MGAGRIFVGVGGWTFPPWRGTFFPADLPVARELHHASRVLTSIEVNGTFYRTQSPATFQRWHDETPDGFVLSLKAPRYATNRTVLAEAGPSVIRFVESGIDRLGHRLGPINWQFAPTKRFEPQDFEAFLDLLPERVDGLRLRHAVEVRHASFACEALVAMARARGVAIVLAGDAAWPQIADPTADFAYLRIMGTTEDQPLGYAPDALDAWVTRARGLAAGETPPDLATAAVGGAIGAPRDVFVYVISGAKVRNPAAALALLSRLAG